MRRVVLVAAVALVAAGCAAKKPSSANEYFNIASRELSQGSYGQAVDNYRTLLDEYPFSEYSEEAELKIGVAHYKNGSCPEATAAFTDFQRRHPTSPYSELARERLEYCRETLAEHELEIAQFYMRHDNDKAAETRLLDLANRFNDTDTAGDALYQLGELYRDERQPEKAILAFAAVEYHHPDHDAARRAETELKTLLGDESPPTGDPFASLKAETGRDRNIAVAQTVRPLQDQRQQAHRGSPQPGTGLGLPSGNTGPFGRSGGTGPYGGRY